MSPAPQLPAVEIRQVAKYFPAWGLRKLLKFRRLPGTWALRDVNLTIWPGECLCLLGPNGAGKTTLIKLIATLLEPTEGTIRVFGRDTVRASQKARARLGYVTCNETSFYGRLTGWQNLAFFARLQNLVPETVIPPVAGYLGLEPYLERRFFTYSTGIKRRLDIARGLLHQPEVLILDEPTTNLDPLAALEVRDLLARLHRQGKTLILVTHRLEEARRLGTRFGFLVQGRYREVNPGPEDSLESLYRRVIKEGESDATPV